MSYHDASDFGTSVAYSPFQWADIHKEDTIRLKKDQKKGELEMNRDINSGISINRSNNLKIIFATISFLLLFVGSLTMAYADDYSTDFKAYSGHGRYYYEESGFQPGERGERGNGATGVLAAFLLILANLTVLLSLILKRINSLFPLSRETKDSIAAFNRSQKRYMRPLHYYLNPIAIIIAVIHFHLSTCRSIIPDVTLILFIIIGILGVILKFQLFNKNICKSIYSLHCSWIVFSIMILALTIGHSTI